MKINKKLIIALLLCATNVNAESLDSNFCRACDAEMLAEVAPYLPRDKSGNVLRPVDDTTVLRIYRDLWKSASKAADDTANLWAMDRTQFLLSAQRAARACAKGRARK